MAKSLALATITIVFFNSYHICAMEPAVADRNALLFFKSGVQGNLSDWGSRRIGSCNWTGVTCDLRGRVISLMLFSFNLTGVISPAIGNLSALEVLDLSYNQLSSNIPPELGKLSKLGSLRLQYNLLTGVIPKTFGLLKSMTEISLSWNNITGDIPDICNCSSLTTIYLNENNHIGEIPFSARCQLPYLDTFDLSGNRLVGVIPLSMSNLTNICCVGLHRNFLSGVLPSQIFNKLNSLYVLRLSNDNFSSDRRNTDLEPFLASLVNCTGIAEIDLYSSGIRGNIPPIIGNLTAELIYLNDNKISGAIPHSIRKLPFVEYLGLSNNMLGGPIPSGILGTAQILSYVDMSYNYLQGAIPKTLSNLTHLQHLVLRPHSVWSYLKHQA